MEKTMHLDATCLRSDKRRREHRLWAEWMAASVELANRFWVEAEDDPFQYGETASVGFLSGAAVKAGFISLPEFAVQKVDRSDRRKRARGRSDLWVNAEGVDWWFEWKQHFISRGSDNDLHRKWMAAEHCASQVRLQGVAVAGLVISFSWLKANRLGKLADARQAVDRFVANKQFAWRLADGDEDAETYIVLQIN